MEITFYEKKTVGRGIQHLFLKLKGHEKEIIIKEKDRIDVGENVIIHYDNQSGNAIFCEGYEIMGPKGDVIHRYADDEKYIFVD